MRCRRRRNRRTKRKSSSDWRSTSLRETPSSLAILSSSRRTAGGRLNRRIVSPARGQDPPPASDVEAAPGRRLPTDEPIEVEGRRLPPRWLSQGARLGYRTKGGRPWTL